MEANSNSVFTYTSKALSAATSSAEGNFLMLLFTYSRKHN